MGLHELETKREIFVTRLSSPSRLSKKSRTMRLVHHPWKMIYPKLIKIANKTAEVEARTFWGQKINVVLPEVVSNFIWRYGYFEEDVCLFMLYLLQRGMTFVDVGAHFGFFTLLGAYLVGREGKVVSFEPIPDTYRQLKKNIAGCPNVDLYNYAAFSQETDIKFYDYGQEYSAFNSAFGMRTESDPVNSKRELIVKARTIDNIIKEGGHEHVDLVKIDAESCEMHVLIGMNETLKTHRPNVILEVGDFEFDGVPKSEEIVTWLQDRGFSPYEFYNGVFVKHYKKAHYEYGNLLFMAEK